jgi:hypothetical protein
MGKRLRCLVRHSRSSLVAITGGPGKYEGAEGQIEVQPVSQDSGIHIFH